MSDPDRIISTEKIDATFIEGPNGPLFCIYAYAESSDFSGGVSKRNVSLLPSDGVREERPRHIVLFVPPFGEEINLCRRFYSLLRTRLSAAGLYCVQPDLYGTGDSAGLFEDATWEIWQSDLEFVFQKYCLSQEDDQTDISLSIIAMRAGCLLTQQFLTSSSFLVSNVVLDNIVFIQPESNGFDIVNRLFRARVTAQRFSGNKTQTSADLWACIDWGETVYAVGHGLSSKLCKVLQHIHLELSTAAIFRRQVLFTLESDIGKQESPSWEVNTLPAKPFWQSYDIEPDSALINVVAEAIEH